MEATVRKLLILYDFRKRISTSRTPPKEVRLVEVKCPHWDEPSQEQGQFLRAASELGIQASIVEWEFGAAQPGAVGGAPQAARPELSR